MREDNRRYTFSLEKVTCVLVEQWIEVKKLYFDLFLTNAQLLSSQDIN